MKLSYGLKNLRRLEDTGLLELRPITLLLGRNSAGKSTFLRSFQLLQQSNVDDASAPILWFGSNVDFGNYQTAVHASNIESDISFLFRITDHRFRIDKPPLLGRNAGPIRYDELGAVQALLEFTVGGNAEQTNRKSTKVSSGDESKRLTVVMDASGYFVDNLLLDNDDVTWIISNHLMYISESGLFSTPLFYKRIEPSQGAARVKIRHRREIFVEQIFNEISSKVGKNVKADTIWQEAQKILDCPTLSQSELTRISRGSMVSFKSLYKRLQEGKLEKTHERVSAICEVNHLINLMISSCQSLSNHFENVEYIGPARVKTERYYRQQELKVTNINADGKNLPMFLASLPAHRLDQFSDWVREHFDYGVSISKEGGHVSVILHQDGLAINIVDTGYGVSQILPILAQIWWMKVDGRNGKFRHSRDSREKSRATLVIEQPELHLHPAHQSLLADVFVSAVNELADDAEAINFVVETHSEAIINKIGQLIRAKSISPDDVQVIIFGSSGESSDISISNYDDRGILQSWPFGFFSY